MAVLFGWIAVSEQGSTEDLRWDQLRSWLPALQASILRLAASREGVYRLPPFLLFFFAGGDWRS